MRQFALVSMNVPFCSGTRCGLAHLIDRVDRILTESVSILADGPAQLLPTVKCGFGDLKGNDFT